MMAGAMGVANIATQGSQEVTIAAIGVCSAAFIWDKAQAAIRKE